MKVAILGTGPSAAYVVAACNKFEVEHKVISNAFPPKTYSGAFWPRLNPTNLTLPMKQVYIYSVGTAEGYLRKQWGDDFRKEWLDTCSFPTESKSELAYDPYSLFQILWKDVNISLVHDLSDREIRKLAMKYDIVFMTFPTEKSKRSQKDYIIQYPITSFPMNNSETYQYCVYSGRDAENAVRMSNLFGFLHTEYSKDHIVNADLLDGGTVQWVRDTYPDTPEWDAFDVPADNVVLVGRWAQWKRKVLAHNAYETTMAVLKELT